MTVLFGTHSSPTHGETKKTMEKALDVNVSRLIVTEMYMLDWRVSRFIESIFSLSVIRHVPVITERDLSIKIKTVHVQA